MVKRTHRFANTLKVMKKYQYKGLHGARWPGSMRNLLLVTRVRNRIQKPNHTASDPSVYLLRSRRKNT
jgi:hypothetical protein